MAGRMGAIPAVTALALALLLGPLGCGGGAEGRAADAGALEPAELEALLGAGEGIVVLDVRSPEEFERGHVPGARLLPHRELPDRVHELAGHRDATVVVYCERGGRASAAARVLREAGFRDVRELAGHMARWRREGRPLEGPGGPPGR